MPGLSWIDDSDCCINEQNSFFCFLIGHLLDTVYHEKQHQCKQQQDIQAVLMKAKFKEFQQKAYNIE